MDKKKASSITEQLGHLISDLWVLYVKTLNFHWNMTGSEFFMYHKLLDAQYRELQETIDEIAERMRQLNARAPGTMGEFLQNACLKETKSVPTQAKMIAELAKENATLVEHLRVLISFCEEMEDPGTADLLVSKMRLLDKNSWILRSHLGKS